MSQVPTDCATWPGRFYNKVAPFFTSSSGFMLFAYSAIFNFSALLNTVELQLLEHLWDYENMFETGVV